MSGRSESVEAWLAALAKRPEHLPPALAKTLGDMWAQACAIPIDTAPTWLHGDLHPRNVIVHEGALAAIVDWGDLCRGDRATDLASLWTLLPSPEARAHARALIDAQSQANSELLWTRAMGWALFFGTILLKAGLDDGDAAFALAGRRTLERVAADTERSIHVSARS